MPGIYSEKVERRIQEMHEDDNILQRYDNYTYHIQFFMLPAEIQEKVDRYEEQSDVYEELIKKHKIVIAESGVTPGVNIPNFTIHSVCPGGVLVSTALTFELTLEDLSNELINKIAVVSRLIGYDNHQIHPYYIELWFTGYENVSKAASGVPKNNIAGRHYLYKTIISNKKIEQKSNKCVYNFNLIWSPTRGNANEYAMTFDLPSLSFDGGVSYAAFCTELQNQINSRFKEFYGEKLYKKVYGDNGDMFVFEFHGTQNILDKVHNTKINSNGIQFKGDPHLKVGELLLKAWQDITELNGLSLFYYPELRYVMDLENQSYYKIICRICFLQCPGLKGIQEFEGGDYNYFDVRRIEKEQLQYLDELFPLTKGIIKKYYLNYTGQNSSVLSYKETDDNLWYLDSGVSAINAEYESKYIDKYFEHDKEEKEKFIALKTKYTNDVGIYNIDDIYFNLTDLQKEIFLQYAYTGTTKNTRDDSINKDASNPDSKEQTSDNSNDKTVALQARLGYNSLFGVSQQKQLDIDIIGDPYWLGIGDEEFVRNIAAYPNYIIPHIILSTASFHPVNENYEQTLNKDMVYHTPFRVLQVVSYFNSGKFTQKLQGNIAIPFIQSSRIIELIKDDTVETDTGRTRIIGTTAEGLPYSTTPELITEQGLPDIVEMETNEGNQFTIKSEDVYDHPDAHLIVKTGDDTGYCIRAEDMDKSNWRKYVAMYRRYKNENDVPNSEETQNMTPVPPDYNTSSDESSPRTALSFINTNENMSRVPDDYNTDNSSLNYSPLPPDYNTNDSSLNYSPLPDDYKY